MNRIEPHELPEMIHKDLICSCYCSDCLLFPLLTSHLLTFENSYLIFSISMPYRTVMRLLSNRNDGRNCSLASVYIAMICPLDELRRLLCIISAIICLFIQIHIHSIKKV